MLKKISKKFYAIVASCVVVAICLASVCLNIFSNASKNSATQSTGAGNTDYSSIERDTSISVNGGVLQIDRTQKEEVMMGAENTWSLFIYMTGSNLESQFQNATKDIQEMFDAKINSENIKNVNIIIQTGGSHSWHSNNISNQQVQRYKVDAGTSELTKITDLGNKNMGEANTLYDFLEWGVETYPAEHMGVIMWNHGSGVSGGVCNDEKFNNDSLSVHELEYTFAKLSKKMTSKFEMIGFDTCLSGSLEYANLLAPYSKYMVASADLEPGAGWFYTPIIDTLLNNPDINGADLGKAICDGYALYCNIMYQGETKVNYTLATYDLSKVDKVCIEANYLTKYLYDKVKSDSNAYWDLESFRLSRLSYGMNNTDLGSILDYFDNSTKFSYGTSNFRQAINEMIIYSKICDPYVEKKALGVTLYLPSVDLTLKELNTYRNVCFSPYWLNYIEWINMRNATEDMSGFKEIKWDTSEYFFEKNFDFLNYDLSEDITFDINNMLKNILITNSGYASAGFADDWYSNASHGSNNMFGGFASFDMMRDVKLEYNNNNVTATIDKNEAYKINQVNNTIFANINGAVVCLGENNKVNFDKNTGEIKSTFKGEWFMLPDGQLLTTYIVSREDNVTVYSFPVMIGDTEASIRIEETTIGSTSTYKVMGVWDSIDNTYNTDGFARGYLPLEAGTKITPIYDVFNFEEGTYESEYGEEYTIPSEFEFYFTTLDDGEYSFAYEIEKLNKTSEYSELVNFNVQNDSLSFN